MKFTVGIGTVRPQTIEAAARSIRRQTWRDWELIVVGQGSDAALPEVGERLQASDPRIQYVHLDRAGVCRARNAVIRHTGGDVIALMDDDCEAAPDWLATVAGYMEADCSIGLVGGALVCPPKPRLALSTCPVLIPAETLYDPIPARGRAPAGWDWIGCSVAMRTHVAAQVGQFDEWLGPGTPFPAAEDTDYKLRLEMKGVRMVSTPRAVVRHTYGRRVGLPAVMRSSRNYARGNGGLAGKLTLLGDPRGQVWVAATRRLFWRDILRPGRMPAALYRLQHFLSAYAEVMAGYTIDEATGCLVPKADAERWLSEVPGIAG